MPFFVSVAGTAQLAELTRFVTSNHGLAIEQGWYLLPWSGVPDVLTKVVHSLVPPETTVVIAAVTDYWSIRN